MNILVGRIVFSLLFGGVGIYLLTVAYRVYLKQREWDTGGISTEGEIIAFEERASRSRSATWRTLPAPVVTFTTGDGTLRRFTSSTAQRPNSYTVGQKVRVRYLASDPKTADLEAVTSSWFALVAILVLAVVALGVASLPLILPPPAHA